VVKFLGYVWSAPMGLVGALVALVALAMGDRAHWRDGAIVVNAEDGPIGRRLRARGWGGVAIGWTILLWQDHPLVEAHERVHVAQALRWGPLFWPAYLVALVAYGYRANPFEVDARRWEQ
jgi:hypothetical protein